MMKKLTIIISSILAIALLSSCSIQEQQRKVAITQRANTFAKAEAAWPVPDTNNFPAREMLSKFTVREDLTNHPYYVYVFSDVGTIIGYYVAQSFPVSTNAFLSSTQDVVSSGTVVTAPSLDGIYYGGSGASSGDGWFFFDATTDALVILYGFKIFVLDQPLKIDAPRIVVGS